MHREPRTALDIDVARLADGDRSAAEPVFATLWPILHRFCARAMRSVADAEDAAQLAMEKVFSRASDYDRTRPAVSWALSIAAWECRTLRRRNERFRREPAQEAENLASLSPDPEDVTSLRELHEAARAVLQELSIPDRETLLAAFSEDAEERLVTGATFRKRKERAIHRLRYAWSKIYGH